MLWVAEKDMMTRLRYACRLFRHTIFPDLPAWGLLPDPLAGVPEHPDPRPKPAPFLYLS